MAFEFKKIFTTEDPDGEEYEEDDSYLTYLLDENEEIGFQMKNDVVMMIYIENFIE